MRLLNMFRRTRPAARLDKFLREKIEEAVKEFDKARPSFIKQIFAGRPKKGHLTVQPIAVKGFNYALRSAIVGGAAPQAVLYQTASNVVIDLMSEYYKNIVDAVKGNNPRPDAILSLSLVKSENVGDKFKYNVARMRHCLQKVILSVAEYIEMQDFSSLNDVLSEEIDPNKIDRVRRFVNAQYNVHVSYKSLSVSLQLFAKINEEILTKLNTNKITNPQKAHSMFVMNSIFVYEIADFIISFISAFELQGIEELKKLHDQAIAEISRGRFQIQKIKNQIEGRLGGDKGRVLRLDERVSSLDRSEGALNELEIEWQGMI